MNRKLKTLGLVLASVFAMSAIGASAASAAEFHSEVHPQSVSGTQTTSHVFTTDAGTVTCKKATFSGTTSASTSATQTLTPDYNECTAFGFTNVPVHENGCAYIFNANGTSEVECPSGKKIEITAPFCTTSIGPQHFASGSHTYHNETSILWGFYRKTTHTTKMAYNECGTNKTNGTYTGNTDIKGASGKVWVS